MATKDKISLRPPKSKVNPIGIGSGFVGIDTSLQSSNRTLPVIKTKKDGQDNFLRRFNRRIRQLKIELKEQQRLEKHQTIEKQLVEGSIVSGSILTQRDEDGNIILYEDDAAPNLNIQRNDQFVSVELYDDIFDINAAAAAIDFSIVELKSVDNRIDLLDNFLNTFRTVLPDIPEGDLQFIIRRGVEEQGGELVDPVEFDKLTDGNFSTIIQKLINLQDSAIADSDEIGGLSSQIDSLTKQLEAMGELVLTASTNDAGLNLPTLIRFVANELARRRITAGDTTVRAQEQVSIIKVRAHKFLNNTLGEELCRAEDFLKDERIGGSGIPEKNDNIGTPNPSRDPKAAERDEQKRRRQERQKEQQLEKAETIARNAAAFNKRRLVDVTFLTEFSETTTLRMTIPFDVRVPTLTNIHGFNELVTGIRFKLNDAGSFKGWFRNDLNVAQGQEYVTEQLEPNTRFILKAAIESFEAPNANLPDNSFPPNKEIDELTRAEIIERRKLQEEIAEKRKELAKANSPIEKKLIEEKLKKLADEVVQLFQVKDSNVQVVTLPEPQPIIPDDSLDVVMPPMKELKPIGLERPGSGLNIDPDPPPKPTGDPDEPILPLEDDEFDVVDIEETKKKIRQGNDGRIITFGGPSVVDVTPGPIKNDIIVIPPRGRSKDI